MTGSAKQSMATNQGLDCFVALLLAMTAPIEYRHALVRFGLKVLFTYRYTDRENLNFLPFRCIPS
jgi:hypothetical protein